MDWYASGLTMHKYEHSADYLFTNLTNLLKYTERFWIVTFQMNHQKVLIQIYPDPDHQYYIFMCGCTYIKKTHANLDVFILICVSMYPLINNYIGKTL